MQLDELIGQIKKVDYLSSFNALAIAFVDFKKNSFQSVDLLNNEVINYSPFYDLASLTKPLTLSLCYLINPSLFTEEMLLLLDHRGSLPSGGILAKDNYQKQLRAYAIKEAPTLYSDYSALRLQLEIEDQFHQDLRSIVHPYHQEMDYLPYLQNCSFVPTGMRHHRPIVGEVNDHNAFNIKANLAHAGLFATIRGVAQTLLTMQQKFSLIEIIKKGLYQQKVYYRGFSIGGPYDGRAPDSPIFGHLGFTGTSFWINSAHYRGAILLSNATQRYFYDRSSLIILRQLVGAYVY